MFDTRDSAPSRPDVATEARGWLRHLGNAVLVDDDAARIDEMEALERLKAAAAARQARLTEALRCSQRTRQRRAGVRRHEQERGIASQVGLARHDSPVKGARHLGLATALVNELPQTLAALERGDISEWRATLVARETACLSSADRATVDAEIGPRLSGYGDRRTADEARKQAYLLDPAATLRRSSRAAADRHVSLRPAPDTMTYLTGLLPVKDGVAAYTALTRHADSAKASGDPRSRGQIMADELAARLTGRSTADPSDIEVVLTVGIDALAAGPTEGSLMALESTRREFPERLRKALIVRDQTCRTPWCDAPIRHADHVRSAAEGGPTSIENGQGLCAACNYAKTAPGWNAQSSAAAPWAIETTTPTGHRSCSPPPSLPGARPPIRRRAGPVDPGSANQSRRFRVVRIPYRWVRERAVTDLVLAG